MDKKIMGLVGGIAAVFLVLVVAAVLTTGGSQVTIVNETFNIPQGFSEVDPSNSSVVAVYARNTESKYFMNDANETIIIQVYQSSEVLNDVPVMPGEVNKTMGGINGLYKIDDEDHVFRYPHGTHGITITAPSDELIEQVLR